MITYVTSDGKKFEVHADAQKHEAELLANQREAAKKVWLVEKKVAYGQLVQKITEAQNAIKAYNQKYNDTISFNVKLQFNDNIDGYSDDKTETETETEPQKKNTFTINTRFDSDEQAKSLSELINSLYRF